MPSKHHIITLMLISMITLSIFVTIVHSEINSKPYVSGTTIYAGDASPLRLQGFNADESISRESIEWLKKNGMQYFTFTTDLPRSPSFAVSLSCMR